MRKSLLLFAAVLIGVPTLVDGVAAQVLKTQTFTNSQGKVVETPYITRTEFRNVRLNGPSGKVRLGEIMIVASVDEATGFLGKPDSTKIVQYDGGGSYERYIQLIYEGMKVAFMDAAGKIRLEKFQIDAHRYSVKIGNRKLRPGMPSGRLSKAIRNSQAGDESSPTRSHLIRISKGKTKTSKKGPNTSELAEHEAISIEVDKSTGKVVQVRYYTVI